MTKLSKNMHRYRENVIRIRILNFFAGLTRIRHSTFSQILRRHFVPGTIIFCVNVHIRRTFVDRMKSRSKIGNEETHTVRNSLITTECRAHTF